MFPAYLCTWSAVRTGWGFRRRGTLDSSGHKCHWRGLVAMSCCFFSKARTSNHKCTRKSGNEGPVACPLRAIDLRNTLRCSWSNERVMDTCISKVFPPSGRTHIRPNARCVKLGHAQVPAETTPQRHLEIWARMPFPQHVTTLPPPLTGQQQRCVNRPHVRARARAPSAAGVCDNCAVVEFACWNEAGGNRLLCAQICESRR